MTVVGGPVQGGKICGAGSRKGAAGRRPRPGRNNGFRTVLSEPVRGHLGRTDLSSVFPGFSAEKELGLLRV
jgi:hypothetical protein